MKTNQWSLDTLVLVVGLGVLFTLFLPAGTYIVASVSQWQERALEERGFALVNILEREIANPLLVNDRLTMHDILSKANSTDETITYLCIENGRGDIVAHTFEDGFPSVLTELWRDTRGKSRVVRFKTKEGPFVDIAGATFPKDVGTLHAGLSREQVIQSTHRLLWLLGSVLTGTMLVLLAGVHFIAARVSLPLQQLAEKVSLFPEKGPIDVTRPASGTREVALIARGFAEMSDRIDLLERERKVTQERMIHTERLAALGELAAGLAHEIHNPLDGMSECLRYLESDPHDADRAAKYYPMLKEGLERIGRVMHGMLTFAGSGRKASVGAFSLSDIIESLRLLIQPRLEGRQVRLTWENPENCVCLCDRQELLQAALNLVLNGAEAAKGHANPEVRIEASCDSEWVYLTVEDSGPGVPEELKEKIFRPFFTTKPVGKGTGLGLSVSRELIHAIGGNIELSPERGTLGGARFVIRLSKVFCEEDQNGQDAGQYSDS